MKFESEYVKHAKARSIADVTMDYLLNYTNNTKVIHN